MKKENQNAAALQLNFGGQVINLPGSVLRTLPNATAEDLKILAVIAADPSLPPEEILAAAGIADKSAYDTALAFWRGAGVIGAQSASTGRAAAKKSEEAVTSIPTYTAEEIADIVSGNVSIAGMVDECMTLLGTVNQTAGMKLVAAVEFFNVEPEYIVTVTSYCVRIGKKSLGYVLSTVSSLCKAGIDTMDLLNDYLLGIEKTVTFEPQIRQLVGMSMTRELSSREKEYFAAWSGAYKYGIDVVRLAYEITVDTIGEPSLAYMNGILSKWNSENLRTAEEVNEYIKKTKKKQKKDDGMSFDPNDFFAAAIKKAYAGSGTVPEPPKREEASRNYNPGASKNRK